MSPCRWKKLTSAVVSKNPWWSYRRDTFELPSGVNGEYHYVHTNGASLIVPVLPNGSLLLVQQYRYLGDRVSLEFPCGGVKEGSTYDETAVHELQEEAGRIARQWSMAGEFNPYNGVTDEICRVYIARELQTIPASPDVTEEFEIVEMRPEAFEAKILSGVVWDGMTIAGWSIAKSFL
jgi:ADP-ribose pyrophosphatase